MKEKKIVISLVLMWMLIMPAGAWSLSLNVVAGQLMGATDVDVGGTLYDVEFVDGTCVDLFGGCNEASDFAFTTLGEVVSASIALLGQVFLDGVYAFDTDPSLTNGVEGRVWAGYVYTPYYGPEAAMAADYVDTMYATNTIGIGGDYVPSWLMGISILRSYDTVPNERAVFAYWTEAASLGPAPVPEPSTIILLVSGLAGLSFMRRKRQEK